MRRFCLSFTSFRSSPIRRFSSNTNSTYEEQVKKYLPNLKMAAEAIQSASGILITAGAGMGVDSGK